MCSTNGECECGTLSRCNSFLLNSPCVSFLYSACICGIWKFDCIGLLEWQLKMACIIHWGTKIQCHIEFTEHYCMWIIVSVCVCTHWQKGSNCSKVSFVGWAVNSGSVWISLFITIRRYDCSSFLLFSTNLASYKLIQIHGSNVLKG